MVKGKLGEEQGSVMVMVVIGLIVLIGFTGLVIDGGSLYMNKSRLQNAADAAALAGAQSLPAAGSVANVAVTYAGYNGMEPLTTDITSSGNQYTALRATDKVEATIIPANWTTSTVPAYTSDQLAAKRDALEVDMGTSTDPVLIGYAELYGVSVGMVTVPAHTSPEVAAKRTELTTLYNSMSNDNLEAEAQAKSLGTYLQTSAQLALDLDAMTDSGVITYANLYSINISSYLNSGSFSNATKRNNAEAFIVDQRNGGKDLIINDKTALVAALIDRGTVDFQNETVSTISDRPGLIEAVIDAMIADYANDTVEVKSGHADRVRVTCTRTVENSFMAILGFRNSTVSAVAMAEKVSEWNGDGLPFINVDPFAEGEAFETWAKTSEGFFSCIHSEDYSIIGTPPDEVFRVDWHDGIIPKNGTVADKKQEIEHLWNRLQYQTVYVFSLSQEVIERGWVEFANGTILPIEDMNNIPNSGSDEYNLLPEQIILLECTWDNYDAQDMVLDLTFTGVSYNIFDDDIPLENIMFGGGSSTRLIE